MVDNTFMFSTYKGNLYVKYTLDRYITNFHVDENKTITATGVNNDQPLWSLLLAKVKCNKVRKVG